MNPLLTDLPSLENSSEFLLSFTDTNFRFLHTNRLFQKHFGLNDGNWKGRPFNEVVQIFQIEKFLEANEECMRNPGKTVGIEIQTTSGANENWFRWEVIAVSNESKQVAGVRFLGTDITAQKKAEQTLLQQAILLDNISDVIISADNDFRIKSWNRTAEMMFDLKYDCDHETILHQINRIKFATGSESNFREALQTNGCWKGDIIVEKKDGAKFYLQTTVNAIRDKMGQSTGCVAVSRNVTKEHETKSEFDVQQKKIQLDLLKEQKQFKTFMEHAPALAWINDEEGTLHYVNSLFKESFRLPDDVIGKNIFNYYPPATKENCLASDATVLNTNAGFEGYEEFTDEKGEKIYGQVYKFPVGTQDDLRLVGGLAINITSQVKTKMEIIKEKKRFQSFMENAPLLAWITDEEGVLYYMNSRFKEAYNYTDEHVNKKIGALGKITEREKILLPNKDVLNKNESIELFHEWVDENNKIHYYKTFKFPIKNKEGGTLAGGQSIEITGEILAQQALKQSNELFEYAGKATRDVIWDWDLTKNKIRRTGGYKTVFGYEMTDQFEGGFNEKIHPDNFDHVIELSKKAMDGDDSRWQMEYKYLCADGSYKIVIDQAYIIRDKDGKAIRVIGSMQDVTEERNLQRQVLMTEVQKKKDVVTAVIDAQEKERNELSTELHDNVNQLLAASILYLKTAKQQKLNSEQLISQSLGYVEKAVDELRNISHNLTPAELKMDGLSSALEILAGKLRIPNTFEVKFVRGRLDETKITSSIQLGVYRIVQEKINNILKHAHATAVTINLKEQKNTLVLTVTDNGNGFDQATIKKGLGIINIYNRAESLGGSAEIISSPGNGCTLHVRIPFA